MVHLNVLAPVPKAVIPEVGLVGVVMIAVPETNVHNPVPTAGVLAARTVVVAQIV